MYAPNLNPRDRGGAAIAVVLIHIAFAIGILNATDRIDLPQEVQRTLKVFDVTPPEPVRPPPPPQPTTADKPKQKEGAAAPRNIESKATPVVAPKPRIVIPEPPKIAVSETPREGTQPTQGASDVRGLGTGAGGSGTGNGSGGAGSGDGGGGAGGISQGPRLVRGITNRDYPRDIQRNWPSGGAIFLRLRIGPDGRPTQCDVMRSFGDPRADQLTCGLLLQRGLFRPALDRDGRPVSAWYGYIQRETGRFDR